MGAIAVTVVGRGVFRRLNRTASRFPLRSEDSGQELAQKRQTSNTRMDAWSMDISPVQSKVPVPVERPVSYG
jgi:outer membrane lipoprotein SlyB